MFRLLFPSKHKELEELRIENYRLKIKINDLNKYKQSLKKRLKSFKKSNTRMQRKLSKKK